MQPQMMIKGLTLKQATEVSYQLMTKGATFEAREASTSRERTFTRDDGDDWIIILTGGY